MLGALLKRIGRGRSASRNILEIKAKEGELTKEQLSEAAHAVLAFALGSEFKPKGEVETKNTISYVDMSAGGATTSIPALGRELSRTQDGLAAAMSSFAHVIDHGYPASAQPYEGVPEPVDTSGLAPLTLEATRELKPGQLVVALDDLTEKDHFCSVQYAGRQCGQLAPTIDGTYIFSGEAVDIFNALVLGLDVDSLRAAESGTGGGIAVQTPIQKGRVYVATRCGEIFDDSYVWKPGDGPLEAAEMNVTAPLISVDAVANCTIRKGIEGVGGVRNFDAISFAVYEGQKYITPKTSD